MFLNRFVGIRIISAVTAIIFFWSQGGLAQNLSQPQLVHPQVKLDIVQDVHCNLQTQNTIFNYLTDLHAQNQLSGILQEGASGNIDRSIWTRLNSVKRTKIVQGLYRDGWMGGAEKFAIEHPGVSYAGIELKALYEVHRDVYRDVIRKREAARESLRTLNAVVSSLKLKYYSNELIRLDNEWRIACHDGSRLFLFLKNNMKNIPFGRLSEFGADFKNLVEAIKTEKAPKNLSVDHFGAELEIFYEILRSRLLSSDEARRLAIVSDYLNLLNDLWNLELTPESYERFLSCESNTKLKIEIAYLLALENQTTSVSFFAYENRDAAKAYYEMAKQRDEAMYRNVLLALKNKRGHFVLVAGGFHGPDLARRFKKDPISVSLVQPRFTEIDPNLQEKYARAMGGFAAHKNLRMFLHNLMMLMPEPATVLPEVRELLEAASLGRDEAVPVPVVLSVDTPFQFTTKVTLRLKTDTDHEILMKNGEIVSGDFREALVEGANCFMKGPKPQVFQTRSGNFFSFKIDRNKEGALVLGTFLPSDPAREYSIRFQIEPEEADPELEIVGEPFINFPDQFSSEEYFTEWIRKRVSVAFVQLSDDLILIVKKTGDVFLAKIKEGKAFGSINSQADLEVIEKISVNASAGPVIIIPKSQSLKIHSLSDEQTSYQKPFFVNRNGDTLSLQLTEGGASWSAQRIEDIPIEPRPLARKFSWVKALSFLLLMPIVGYLLSTSKVKETPKFLLTPTPDVANPIIPAPVVSTTPAPIASPSVASVSSVQLQETVASDTTTAVSISPPAEMPSSAVVSKGGPDLPEAINNKISPATRAVFSAADGIVSISSDNKFLFVVQEDLLKKREVIQDRFNELVRSIPENEEQYKIDFHFNDAYRGNLNPVDPKAEQLMQELIQVSNELNRIDQDLLSGQVLIQDGRLLVKSGDHVVKGDGLIEYDIANRSKVEMRLPRKLAVALMLKQATLKSLNNVTAQADVSIPEGDISSPEIEKTVTIEFDTPTENIPIEIVKTEKGIRSEDSPSGPEIINVVAPRAGWVEINKNLLRLGKIRKGDVIATYSKPNIDAGIRRIEQKIIAAEAFADCLSVAFDKLTPLVAQAKADIVSFDNQLEGAFYNKPKVVQLIAEKQLRKDFLSDVEKIKLKRDTARSVVQQYETDKAKLESRSLPKTYVVKAPCDGDLIFSHPDQSYFWTNSGIVVKIIRTDAKSLGVEHVTPLTVDEPFRFSAKDKLKLKTETGREILFEEGEVVLGGAREPVVDGANCFMKGPKPQVFQTRSGNFFSFKIDRNKEGALVLGTFLPSDPAREYSIRFQIEPEEADPELEIVGEPFINFPDQFSSEEYFTEWIRKRVSVAFVQLSDDLILIVKKTGDVFLAKIKEGKAFGSINSQADLEVIEKISVNASAGPVIIIPKSQSLKIHSLSDEQTSYQKPFFVNRNGDTLSLQLTEGGASWSVEQFEDVPIEAEPSPKARKSPWIIIALGFTLPLIFEIYHLVSSKTPEVPNSVTTPTPTLVAKVEPPAAAVVTHSAAVVSSPTPASDTSPSVVLVTPSEPVAPVASPTVVSVPSETIAVLKSETKPDTSIAEKPGTFQLPHTFESALEPVMLPIVAVRAGIFSISPVTSTTAYSVISPGLTDKKVWFEQKIKELKTKVTVEHARWEGEKQINREQTPKVKLPETSLKEWNLKKELEKALADLREIELKIQACSVQRSYFGGYETQFTTQDGATVAMGEKIGEAVSKKLKKIATRVPNDIAVLIANGSVTLAANGVHLQVLSGNVDFGAGRDSEVTFVVRMSEESISSVEKVHFELLNISIGEEAKLSEASSGPFSGTLVSNPVETIRAASSGLLVLKSLLNRQGIGVTRGTEVGWYETVNLGEEYLSLKEAAEKIGRLKQQLVLINDLKLELKRAQAEINKLSELQSPDRNQEEADKKQLTPELKSLFDDIKSFESVKADEAKRPEDAEKEEKPRDGISRILRHYAELRNSESKLQAKGIIWSECHKILELLNAELVKFESGDAPNFNTVAEKINELFQKDLSFIPSAEEKEAVRKRLQDEKKRMESRLLIVVSPGKDMTLDQAFDDHSQKIKSLLALLEAGVNASKIVAAVDGRIIKPADSFLIYAEKGQELFAISTGSTVTLSIPQDKASSFKQDDDVLVAIGPSVTKGRVSGLSPLPDNKFEVKIVLPFASGNAEIPVRIYTVHAKSLGAFDRREFLKLAALVGAALAAGCQITKERIEQIRNDHGIGVPNSLTTPASEVNLKEIILKLNDIAERHKNQTDESGFKSLIEYLPARNHGIREAQYKKDDAQGTSSFMAGFGITPQFSVNHDLNGGVGINGGFVIQIPTALGGGALYFPFGVNSLEEDVKATFSFVASTQNLVMGLGNYYSDLSDIAVRSAVYELQNLIVTEVARVQHLYRELYFLKKSEEILKSQLVILNDEKTYAQNLNDRAYQKKVLEKVAAKQGELDSVREGIEDKIELLYRALNISPEVPFNFNDFEELKTQAVETFEVSGDTEKEILRRVALVDKRVGLAHDRFTAFSYLKLLDERKANIPDAVLYLFGGHGVNQTTDLSFGNDQNRINFIRRSLREGGMILRLPELTTFIPRIFSGNIDDIDALKRQRVEMIDEVKKLVLEEVRDSKKDYDRRLAAIIKAQRALSTAQRELVSLDSDRENEEATFADVFAKRIEIQDLEMDLGKKKMEFQEALSKFSGYFPDAAEWKRNKLNKAREGEVIREESKPHLDDMRDFVNSSISYQTRQFDSVEALVDSVNGKSLGRELSSNLKDRGLLSNHILAGRIGFLSVLFGSILGVRSRKMAWAKFQERFGKKLDAFTQDPRTQSKVEKLTKPVSIFIEESDLSVRPEFLVQFLQRSVHVDVFVQAGNRANALVKLAAYFPEASIPKNLSVHYYNPSLPLHDAMSRQIKLANESNIVPVVIGDGAKFFKKLEVRTRIIKVSHQKVYPKELVLELGRRIGISNGMIGQIAGDERGLIGYDDKRDMFNLLPLEKLIDELFQQVVRDYQLQIAA